MTHDSSRRNLLPKAPFVYINDPTNDSQVATKLFSLFPHAEQLDMALLLLRPTSDCPDYLGASRYQNTVLIATDNHKLLFNDNDLDRTIRVHRAAGYHRCTGLSVHLHTRDLLETKSWSDNHLDLAIGKDRSSVTNAEARVLAQYIYRWMFSKLSVKESLHLIHNSEMEKVANSSPLKDYKNCYISDADKVRRSARIQFTCIIVTKPKPKSEDLLTWEIADKTGVASFHFRCRGHRTSLLTWDWILNLEPGQLTCLPRMPYILLEEKVVSSVIRLPVRVPNGLARKIGKKIPALSASSTAIANKPQIGPREMWVSEADIEQYLAQNKNLKVVAENKQTFQAFTPKAITLLRCRSSTRDAENEKPSEEEMECRQ